MTDLSVYTTEIVNKDYKGTRIDKFLVQNFADLSRSQIQRLLKEGYVSCDEDTIGDNSFKVREGDVYTLTVPPAAEANPQPENIALDIVYEDEDLVVVNKPAGMTVHPAPGAPNHTLVNAMLYHCRESLSGIGGVKRPGIVHRIDKDTSGLLVVAKNDAAHQGLCAQFAEHSIERTYFAWVFGAPNPLSGRVEANIGRSPYDRKKMAVVNGNGKFAVTNYKTLEIYKNVAAKVQCNLETGRTHQIRVHMASLGHHLIGDQVYIKAKKINDKTLNPQIQDYINLFPRQALHAASLGFIHPRSGEKVQFWADLPEDLGTLSSNLKLL